MRQRKRLLKHLISPVIAVVLLVPTACSTDSVPESATAPSAPPTDASRWVSGALHVHSRYSDGAGSVAAIAAAASSVGLDFVVLTDHWSLDALEKGEEGYRNGVLTLVGVEASTDAGHVLGLDLPRTPMRFGRRDPEEVLDQIDHLGGFAVAAHPNADRESFRWRGWDLRGYQGIEVFNAYSAYRRNGVMVSLAYFFVNPFWQTESVNWELDFDPSLVATWDRMLQDRKLSGWGGVDAHGGIEFSDDRFIPWPSYERVFRMARNFLLLDRPLTGVLEEDRALVYQALHEGRGYVALNDAPEAARFRFWAEAGGDSFPVGSDLELPVKGREVTFRASVPRSDAELRLFRDGALVAESRAGELTYATDRFGVYRVEALVAASRLVGEGSEPWIISNPIALLEPERIHARIAANGLGQYGWLDMPPGDLSEYPLSLRVERNSGCLLLDLATLDPMAFRARFELGTPPADEPELHASPYGRCGIEDRTGHDFSGSDGLSFEVRGDGIYRVSVALEGSKRTRASDGKDWTASFLTSPQWEPVTLPFSRFQAVQRRDGPLDLSSIRGIAFQIDTSNTLPGTSGEIEVRGVSLLGRN